MERSQTLFSKPSLTGFLVVFLIVLTALVLSQPKTESTVTAAPNEKLELSFGEPIPIESDQEVSSLAVGDFNNDGKDDVAAFSGQFRSSVPELMHWYSGPEMSKNVLNSGAFPERLEQFPGAAESADIDGDGDLDLVLGNAGHGGGKAGEIIWFENQAEIGQSAGDWPIHLIQEFTKNAGHMNDIAIADIDQDGKLDVVMRHLGNAETLRILFQDDARNDNWTLRSIGDLPFREGMGMGDMDRDGDPDILLNGYWLETPENPRTEAFTQHTLDDTYFTQPEQGLNNSTKQAFGDIDGDGRTDVVLSTAEGQSGWLAWYSQPDDPRNDAWPRTRLTETTGMHTLQLADFDLDGDLDILTGLALGNKGVSVWLNSGDGSSFIEMVVDGGISAYTGRPFDADGDGDLDIVAQEQCCNGGGDLYWIENLINSDGTPNPTSTPIPVATPMPTATPEPTLPSAFCPVTPVVRYTFEAGSGNIIQDVSGFGSPYNLLIDSGEQEWIDGGGLDILSASRIEAESAATKLISTIKASQSLTLEVWITPANIEQDGPARIVTLSGNSSTRNLTLGQGLFGNQPSDLFDIRLRTTDPNVNDDGQPSMSTSAGSATTNLTHLVYVRHDDGTAQLYINGQLTASDTIAGSLDNWDDGYRLGIGNEFGADRPWLGTFHELSIHACPFTPEDVSEGFSIGAGNIPTLELDNTAFLPAVVRP
ncbi:MAG: FG-GAP-like repeat-containing protein [Chloroflexota bacterium]